MNPQDPPANMGNWPEIQRIFDAALELPAGDREEFVEREAPNAEVARDVHGLLQSHEAAGKLGPMDDEATSATARSATSAMPVGVGPYRILGLLGEGGMGSVYLAERSDGQYEHKVALKLMRDGPELAALRPRFLAERQILAQLVHPNIAWLLDGNVTDDGRPYFVMEYVEDKASRIL